MVTVGPGAVTVCAGAVAVEADAVTVEGGAVTVEAGAVTVVVTVAWEVTVDVRTDADELPEAPAVAPNMNARNTPPEMRRAFRTR